LGSDGKDEFYDLHKDPQEEHNLIATETARSEPASIIIEEWLGSFKHAASGRENVSLDLTIKRLES
jgi:hypothetical protein